MDQEKERDEEKEMRKMSFQKNANQIKLSTVYGSKKEKETKRKKNTLPEKRQQN